MAPVQLDPFRASASATNAHAPDLAEHKGIAVPRIARPDAAELMSASPHSDHSIESAESDGSEFSCPEDYTEFEHLIADIKKILGPTSGLDSDEIDVNELMDRIEQYKSCEDDWKKYAFVDDQVGYTRNGVDDVNHKANLLILCWNPGKGSKVHDHANAHCIVKMLKGTLRETLYAMPSDSSHELEVTKVSEYSTNQVSYMSDNIGLHRMENPGDEVAVSLHLYTPPYASKFGCHVFDEKTGTSTLVSVCNLYSDHGVKNVSGGESC